MSAIGWLLNAVIELLLFILVLRKCKKAEGRGEPRRYTLRSRNPDMIMLMARDSTSYFAVIFSLCLAGTVLGFVTEMGNVWTSFKVFLASQMNAYQTLVLTAMTILAPKLLINMRAEFYRPVGGYLNSQTTQLTWNIATAGGTHTDRILEGSAETTLMLEDHDHANGFSA
ncbi:hypothetical protein ACEPAF_9251 [Sanghuangporus sanghuang]